MIKLLGIVFSLKFFAGLIIGAVGGFVAEFFIARNNSKAIAKASAALTQTTAALNQAANDIKRK